LGCKVLYIKFALKEEEKALAKEQAKAMIKMLADSNLKTEAVDEKVH
jgi:hypothetical protein